MHKRPWQERAKRFHGGQETTTPRRQSFSEKFIEIEEVGREERKQEKERDAEREKGEEGEESKVGGVSPFKDTGHCLPGPRSDAGQRHTLPDPQGVGPGSSGLMDANKKSLE